MICYTNKCIINERYIPEHQNTLNIYDLQNYEFLAIFFQQKKKFVKFEFSIYAAKWNRKELRSMGHTGPRIEQVLPRLPLNVQAHCRLPVQRQYNGWRTQTRSQAITITAVEKVGIGRN